MAVTYTRRQTLAAEAQVREARLAREAQEEALKAQAADTAQALEVAGRNADAAQQSAEAMKRLASATAYRNIV
jgi:D-ribose pyranose/furanose isomerase RbsD